MSERLGDVAASGFLVVLAGTACLVAWRLGLGDVHNPGAGFMPFATAALLGTMALGQLVRQVIVAGARGAGNRPFAQSRWSLVVIVLGALAGFGVAIERAGFTLSTLFLLLVLFGVVARKRWWVALTAALAIAVVARVVLKALGLQLPDGPLGL